MIDERHEELAALYALDLLEGAERAQFETALARDPGLQALVRELRESSSALAHTAPAVPPPAALRERILSSIGAASTDNVIRPPASVFRSVLPWAIAAGFAVAAVGLGTAYLTADHRNDILETERSLAEVTLKSTRASLEAERLVSQRQLATITDTSRQLAEVTQRASTLETRRQEIEQQLASSRSLLGQRETQLAAANAQSSARNEQIAALTQRIDTLTRSAEDAGRQLAAAQQAATKLDAELRSQATVADMKIATLASMLKNSPQALAVALWDPKKQEGVATFEKLPALAANQKFELWVVEDKPNAAPVSAGVFAVAEGGRVTFKPVAPVTAIAAFAVSREKDDGARSHATPGEVVMLGKSK